MGLNTSSDVFCQRTDKAFMHIKGVSKLVDDVLVQGNTYDQLVDRVNKVLASAWEHSVMISGSKMQHGPEVKFAGYIIKSSREGVVVSPDPALLDGLHTFPEPTCVTELQGFLGMLGQLSEWNPNLVQHCTTMRVLLNKGTP